jgi:pimeloyl-ACP methyl ester carboxylesterase
VLDFLAVRAPWALRAVLAKVSRDMRRDPQSVLDLFNDLCATDREVVERPDVTEAFRRGLAEAFRYGTRGVAQDWKLEAAPWRVDLDDVDVPVDLWHGTEDTVVRPEQARALARALPTAEVRLVDGEGHLTVRVNRLREILGHLG